jgi:hypothetical protein
MRWYFELGGDANLINRPHRLRHLPLPRGGREGSGLKNPQNVAMISLTENALV